MIFGSTLKPRPQIAPSLVLYNDAGITNDNHTLGWIIPIRDLGGGELADSDNDGLPDEWEEVYGLDPLDDGSLNPDNGANGDPDGDGLTNIQEYHAGTDPTRFNPEPVLVITYPKPGGILP